MSSNCFHSSVGNMVSPIGEVVQRCWSGLTAAASSLFLAAAALALAFLALGMTAPVAAGTCLAAAALLLVGFPTAACFSASSKASSSSHRGVSSVTPCTSSAVLEDIVLAAMKCLRGLLMCPLSTQIESVQHKPLVTIRLAVMYFSPWTHRHRIGLEQVGAHPRHKAQKCFHKMNFIPA